MQLPLLHRSTQMAVLKKLVRRKVRELRWRRHRAQRRLEMMRQIRWELLRLMQRLLDLRQRDAEQQRREQARRAVGGMLHMYRRWLGKWTRALKSQGRLIRQQEQLKRGLSRRLRLLRRRLRKHHRPKQLVDRCFERLAKAVKRWQRRPDHHQFIEDQELIWAQEVEEVRRYLTDIRGKSVRRRKSPRPRGDDLHVDLPNFNSFWQSEVERRKKKFGMIQASSQETPSEREVYRIPKPPLSSKTCPNLASDQIMRSSRRIPARRLGKKDSLVPSLKELQQVFRLLQDQNLSEQGNGTASTRNSKRKLSRKKAKTDLYQELKREINIRKPQSQRKRDGGNQGSSFLKRLLRIGSDIRSKIQQSRMGSIKRGKKHQWPAMTTLRRRIPIRQKDVKNPKSKFVDEKIRKEMRKAMKKTHKKGQRRMERKKLWDKSDLSHKKNRKPNSKIVEEKNRKELGINNRKSNRRRETIERKIPRESSDHKSSISSSHKNVKKPKSKFVDENIRKAIEALDITSKKGRRRKESMESKNLWDSSDLSISPSQEYARKSRSIVVDEEVKKEITEKESLNVNQRKNSAKSENLWDSSDLVGPGTRRHRPKKIHKMRREKHFSNDSISDDGTDIMVNKLMERKKLYETSMPDQHSVRDSIASFSDSLNQIIMESRKSIRKSIFGWGLLPAGSKSKKRPSMQPNLNQKRTSIRDSLPGNYRPRRSSLSGVSSKRSVKVNTYRRGKMRRSRGTEGSVVQSNDPIAVQSNVPIAAQSNVPIAVQSNVAIQMIQNNEMKVIRSNKGSVKLGIKADHKRSISDQKVNETGKTKSFPFLYEKDYEFGKQDKNSAVPEGDDILRFVRADQTYNQHQNKMVPKEIEVKAAETINQDKNKTAPKISFSIAVEADDPTLYQDVNKTNTDGQRNGQDINYTSQDQDQEASRAVGHEKNINSDPLAHFGKFSHSRSESINEEGLNHKKDEGHREHTTASLVPSKYNIKNLQSDAKYRQIQYFLKDVIETNDILERVPDVQELMKAVGNHYMWDNLKDLYSELLAGGISKADVKRLLTDKYLNYLSSIRKAQMLAPKHVEAREQDNKRQSMSDQLRNLRFWYRHRLSNRSFQSKPNDKGEVRSTGTTQDVKGTMYQKLIAQELMAERAKREKWNKRLRRLLPTSETSASMSFASSNTLWEVEAEEEEDLRTIDERYSITNLRRMMKELEVRFQAMECERMREKARQGKVESKVKLVEEQPESPTPKKLSWQSSKKREKHLMRPINQLYYAPRKTNREQQIIKYYSEYSEDEQCEALEEESEYQDSCMEKCPQCGDKVELPCCVPSPKASSAILSSGSIEACAKNELLVNTVADVCTRCGYVHDPTNPCSQPPEDQRKTLLLRMIKAVQAWRSTTQPPQCSELCSCREILKRQEKDFWSCKSKLRQVESRLRGCPGANAGGGGDR